MINTLQQGHEETHALHAAGQIELLEKAFKAEGIPINFDGARDYNACTSHEREIVAEVGAIYALYKTGFDVAAFADAQRSQTRKNLAQPFIKAQKRQAR